MHSVDIQDHAFLAACAGAAWLLIHSWARRCPIFNAPLSARFCLVMQLSAFWGILQKVVWMRQQITGIMAGTSQWCIAYTITCPT